LDLSGKRCHKGIRIYDLKFQGKPVSRKKSVYSHFESSQITSFKRGKSVKAAAALQEGRLGKTNDLAPLCELADPSL